MKIFTFTGWSGTGKTLLISKLIRELSGRGWKVSAIKNVPEKFHLEPEGKDSRKFLESGASPVYLAAKKQLLKIVPLKKEDDLFELEFKEMAGHDFILSEGEILKNSHIFEIYDPDISKKTKTGAEKLSAIISDTVVSLSGVRLFKRSEIVEIADFMESINKTERNSDENL